MIDPKVVLAGAARPAARPASTRRRQPRRALVVGGAGALGAAVLEHLLASHRYEQVGVVTARALQPALRGLQPVTDSAAALVLFAPDTALIVFDRARHANGRDAAFVRPQPPELPLRAQQLHAAGVRTLVVVVPHAPALLPQALMVGLAGLDEATVAAIGFDHLVFMRMAQSVPGSPAGARTTAPQRVAAWMLSQLKWMVPQREQPVRSATVARVASALAAELPEAPPGTRVLPPELLWQATLLPDQRGVDEMVAGWLDGRSLPSVPVAQRW